MLRNPALLILIIALAFLVIVALPAPRFAAAPLAPFMPNRPRASSPTIPGAGSTTPESSTNTGSVVHSSATALALTGNVPASGTVDTSEWLTYRNPEYGYSFKYPPGYFLGVSEDDLQVIASRSTNSLTVSLGKDGWLQVAVQGNPNWRPFSSEADFIDQARMDLQNNCSYSGPDELTLTDVVSESTSTNQHGILYYEAYFKWISSGNADGGGRPGTRTLGTVGPFYAFDTESETSGLMHLLEVAPVQCVAATSSPAESPTMHAFIDSITF